MKDETDLATPSRAGLNPLDPPESAGEDRCESTYFTSRCTLRAGHPLRHFAIRELTREVRAPLALRKTGVWWDV